MHSKKRHLWIRIIAVLAILISLVLVYEHYKKSPSEFCNIGKSFDCDIVNKSLYSTVDGLFYFLNYDLGLSWVPLLYIPIPVSIIGILTFLIVIGMSYKIENKKSFFNLKQKTQIKVLKWLMVFSIIFALYLVYIEKFVLLFYCIYCLTLDLLIFIEAILIKGL